MAFNAILGATRPCCGPANRGIQSAANLVDVVTTVAVAALLLGVFKVEGFQPCPFTVKLLTAYVGLTALMFSNAGILSSVMQKEGASSPINQHFNHGCSERDAYGAADRWAAVSFRTDDHANG